MRPVINTEKHIVQQSLAAIASGALLSIQFANAKQAPTATAATDVREGSKITAVYVEMWGTSDDTAAGTTIVTLEKRPSGLGVMTAAESASLDAYENKKNILNTMMGLIGPNTQYPMALVKGWFKIPKGKQRFGLADKLVLNIHAQSNGMAVCGFALYKEQF